MSTIILNNKIDKIFSEIGGFGPYQLVIIIIVGSTGIITALNRFSGIFIAAVPKFR